MDPEFLMFWERMFLLRVPGKYRGKSGLGISGVWGRLRFGEWEKREGKKEEKEEKRREREENGRKQKGNGRKGEEKVEKWGKMGREGKMEEKEGKTLFVEVKEEENRI